MRPHVSINVQSVSESVKFYERVFQTPPQKQTGGYAKFDVKNPSLNFSLVEVADSTKVSRVNHFGIEVQKAQEVEEWIQKLKEQGLAHLPEKGTDCCYALQDKVWLQDPDGNSWEIFFVHHQLPVPNPAPKKGVSCCA